MLNKYTVSELAELSNFSKAYISQVRSGKRPPSQALIDCLVGKEQERVKAPKHDYYNLFMQSRKSMGCTPSTLRYYQGKLSIFLSEVNPDTCKEKDIEKFLLQFPNAGNRTTYYRVLKTFFTWREEIFEIKNPMVHIKQPKVGKLILPALDKSQVHLLLEEAKNIRDKAIIALFVESGLRLSELTSIKYHNIDWDRRTIRIIGKGNKEAYAPFGELAESYLKQWFSEYEPTKGNIWGLNSWGICSFLRRLQEQTGIVCNPHTFRRTFACLLRKSGTDSMTIKDLGRWESLEMVQRYTRSITFEDSLRHYQAPLSV